MLATLMRIVLVAIAFISAGTFSYYSTQQMIGEREVIQQPKSDVGRLTLAEMPSATATTAVSKKTPAVKITAPTTTDGSLAVTATTTEKTVVAPGPLRVTREVTSSVTATPQALTRDGVLKYTNIARAQNGSLSALVSNETLDRDAQIKLDDMFGRQYFEHISSTGVGPADLAKTVGYAYVIVGENLALGDFGSDEKLVDAWMNSPGHRANILNTHYQEIGIAVGKGIFEGRETWLAVQSFGMPLSACPTVDVAQKELIENNSEKMASMRAEFDARKTQMENTAPYDSSYNMLVGEYNALVPLYNTLVEVTRSLVETYNTSVRAFNACIEGAQGN